MKNRKQQDPSSSQPKTRYAEITIAAWTGEISAEHLYDPPTQYKGSTSRIWPLESALEHLADGGYVFDLRPLADHPEIGTWVYRSPMPNGRIDGDDIQRLSHEARQFAGEMMEAFGGEFQMLALLASQRIGEPADGSAGPFDYVSSSYRAMYWMNRGALVGKRKGLVLQWSDGTQQTISDTDTLNAMPLREQQSKGGGRAS